MGLKIARGIIGQVQRQSRRLADPNLAGHRCDAVGLRSRAFVNLVSGKDYAIRLEGGPVGVLLFHGLAGTPHELRFVAEVAHRVANATVVCPVTPGHCGTYDDLKAVTFQAWTAFALEQVDALARRCPRIIVGGLSMGAMLAIAVALKRPQAVNGLALLAPTMRLSGWTVPLHAHLFNLIQHKWIANLFDFPDLPPHGIKDEAVRADVMAAMQGADTAQAGLLVTPGGAFWEHLQLMKSVQRDFGQIKQPTLIVHPRQDDIASLNTAFRIASKLGGAVELHVLEDSYHVITLDRQRDRVGQILAGFAQGLASAS